MGLTPGTKLGPYEILCAAGAGGMGEVYRACDTRLDRTVAIKVLPQHLSSNSELKQRFEREGRAISQLQHPHICVLYDVGSQNGTGYIVMEYLEGETLAERLRKGPLPLDQLLKIGIEIADALDKAHRSGIIHRDLKPANVMLTKSGAKLMDFGLARGLVAPAGATASPQNGMPSFTAAQTMTNPASPLTGEGTVIGTLNYMSPEQIEGREADARSDIFAFGAVLYEMATGKRAFEGKSHISVASAILEKEPEPVSAILPTAPPELDRTIKSCLAKEPDDRFQTAHDVRMQLKWISADAGARSKGGAAKSSREQQAPQIRERLAWSLAAISLVAAGILAAIHVRPPPVPNGGVTRFSVAPPPGTVFNLAPGLGTTHPSISPDGRLLAFKVVAADGSIALGLRNISSVEAQVIPNTEGADRPFWSSDARYLGFVANDELKKIAVSAAGTPETICPAPANFGSTWNAAGVIVFSSKGSLYRVDAGGGPPALVKQKKDSDLYFYPQFLPDGRNVLYTSVSPVETERGAFVVSLDTGVSKRLSGTDYKTIYSAGYLLSVQNGDLFAQEFDTKRLLVSSEAHRLPDRINHMIYYARDAEIDAAEGGQLVYVPPALTDVQLTWFNRSGRVEQKVGPVAEYRVPTLSPDGRKLAFDRMPAGSGGRQVWVLDLEKETLTRIAADQSNNWAPVWSPDGRTLAFSSDRDGPFAALYLHSSDGQGADQLLLRADFDARAQMWSAPGLIVSGKGILQLLNPEDHKVTPFPNIGSLHSQFSPDGKFIAYQSNESGTIEIYLRRFPITPERWRVSSKGGLAPLWKGDGRELYYLRPDGQLTATKIQLAPQISIGNEEILFQTPFHNVAEFQNFRSSYAVAPDGSKFLFPEKGRNQTVSMTVVLNWPAMLQH